MRITIEEVIKFFIIFIVLACCVILFFLISAPVNKDHGETFVVRRGGWISVSVEDEKAVILRAAGSSYFRLVSKDGKEQISAIPSEIPPLGFFGTDYFYIRQEVVEDNLWKIVDGKGRIQVRTESSFQEFTDSDSEVVSIQYLRSVRTKTVLSIGIAIAAIVLPIIIDITIPGRNFLLDY